MREPRPFHLGHVESREAVEAYLRMQLEVIDANLDLGTSLTSVQEMHMEGERRAYSQSFLDLTGRVYVRTDASAKRPAP